GSHLHLFRCAPLACLHDRPAVRDPQLGQRNRGPAHDPADPAPDRADAGDRGAGGRKRAGEKRPAAVPVRSPPLRVQGPAARSRARRGQAERPDPQADIDIATQKAARTKAELAYQQYQKLMFTKLVAEQAVREEQIIQTDTRVESAQAANDEAVAEGERARPKYKSQIDGGNTTVAKLEAQLRQQRYYLDNTTLTAPEDGRIINLQVRPGMVSGIYRVGGIAAFIADADRYVLATYFQENLKYMRPGQPVELSFDLYPGQIFSGKVEDIWRANGSGQYLPSDDIPKFQPSLPVVPQGQFAVKIAIDDPDQSKFPIGTQGIAAVYTTGEHGAWAALRKISIRAHSWANWLYPLNF